MRSTTRPTGVSGATRWATCCSVSPVCTWITASRSGTGASPPVTPPNWATRPSHTVIPDAIRASTTVVAGVMGRRRCDARDISTPLPAGSVRPGPPPGAGRSEPGPDHWLVHRHYLDFSGVEDRHLSAFHSVVFALVFECTRSSVRFIEHVIELLPNDRAAHRQVSAARSGRAARCDTPRTHV